MRSLLACLDDPFLFGPFFKDDSWRAWRAFLKALFAEGMTAEEAEVFRAATGRSTLPTEPFDEAIVIVGRRGGKSRILALIAVYLAVARDYEAFLAPGERAIIAILAVDREQAGAIFNFVEGLLRATDLLKPLILDDAAETITLSNRVVIQVTTASFRTTRGYTFAAVLADEVAFWRTEETSVNPDAEIMRALRPGLATIPGSILIMASSPYSKRGELYGGFRRYYGDDAADVLVWKASTAVMNPALDPRVIAREYEKDPVSARAEYGAEFRDDLADYVSAEAVLAVTPSDRRELPLIPGVAYSAFVDPSGGGADAMTLAIGHREDGRDVCVLDALREAWPPLSPEDTVRDFATTLRRYGVVRVTGDRYGGVWVQARFAEHGIELVQSARPKSDLYHDFLPMINSQRVELLDHPRLIAQLCGLERRTARSGRDSIDHPKGGHDDLVNAAAGALVELDLDRRLPLINLGDVMDDDRPLPLPTTAMALFVTICVVGANVAVVYCGSPAGDKRLLIFDVEATALHGGFLPSVIARIKELAGRIHVVFATVIFAPAELLRHLSGVTALIEPMPEHFDADRSLIFASQVVSGRLVRLCQPAAAKMERATIAAALSFKAGDEVETALRSALIAAIALKYDEQLAYRRVSR